MKATLRIATAVFLMSGVVFAAAPAGAQTTPTLTVAPTTNLVNGDVVTVDGAGFTASGTVGYCQGVFDETPDPTDCDSYPSLVRIGLTSVDTAGAFNAQYVVQRFITVSGIGTVDCAQPSAQCAISASNVVGFGVVGPPVVTPISFAPQPPTSLAVTPDTGLVDGDVVVVNGTGFLPDTGVLVCQELDDSASAADTCPTQSVFVVPDGTGAFSVQYTVRRFISPFGAGVTSDCAVASATCAMSAAGFGTNSPSAATAIAFAPQPPVTVAAFGTVTSPTGEPLAGAQVWAYTPADTWVGSLRTVTDAQGSYEFESLALGVPYRILFIRPSGSTFASQWFDQQISRRFATVITLAAGEFVQANAQLADASSISGSVRDTNGNPVAGVTVWAYGPGDTFVGTYATSTGSDGTYRMENVNPGYEYQVRFVPPANSGLAIEWWDNQPLRGSANFFTVVSSEEPTTGIDAVLEPSP